MALLIPDGFAQITFPMFHASGGRPAAVTFGLDVSALPFVTPEFLDDLIIAWGSTIGSLMDAGTGTGPPVASVGTGTSEHLTVTGSSINEGGVTGDTLPSAVAVLIKKVTTRGGRRGRGRMFVPWALRDDQVDDVGNISTSPLTNLQTAATDFLTELVAGVDLHNTTPMVLLHEEEGSTAPGSPDPVVQFVVDPVVATQRRRQRK